jgi:hypothetical protein
MEMSTHQSLKARAIVWKGTQLLIKDSSYLTNQVFIPDSDGVDTPREWRHCADHRNTLYSNWTTTSHPVDQFYSPNPVESNTKGPAQEPNVLPDGNHSIDCET